MKEKANIKTKIAVVGIIVFTLLIIGIISVPNVIEKVGVKVGEKEEQDATSAQVLSGKTFTSSAAGVGAAGAMADFTNNLQTATVASNATGVSTINVPAGYYEQIQVDASAVYNKGEQDGISEIKNALSRPYIVAQNAGGVTSWTASKNYPVIVITTCNANYTGSGSTVPFPYINGQRINYSAGSLWAGKISTWFFIATDVNMGDIITISSDCELWIRVPNVYL